MEKKKKIPQSIFKRKRDAGISLSTPKEITLKSTKVPLSWLKYIFLTVGSFLNRSHILGKTKK